MNNYQTILADPPWPYRQKLGRGKKQGDTTRGGLPYKSMTIDQIKALPVPDLAAPDCMLWLWVTNAHFHEAFHVIEAWGFKYVSKVTWAKAQRGLGYYLRGQTEELLLAIKGRPRSKMKGPNGASGLDWSTLQETPAYINAGRTAHSSKPQVFIDMIEEMGEAPRIELFARARRFGWDAWGDEWYKDES